MQSDYRIAVLIPCHSTKYLAQCIDSFQNQTLSKEVFEVVIVADRVNQGEISEILEGSTLNFRILSTDSPGIVSALNTGLNNISLEYVARMDEDDLMFPDRLEVQLTYLDETPECLAVGGQLELIDADGLSKGETRFQKKIGTSYKKLFSSSPLAHPAVMIRRNALSKIGNYRDFLAEDWDLWVRLREMGGVHNLSQRVIKYRVHSNQLSRQKMYALSRARHIVGVSHFARQLNFVDGPDTPAELEAWLEEATVFLKKKSIKFNLFLLWTKRVDLYQEKFNSLLANKKKLVLVSLLIQHPFWLSRDILKKILR